jgi:hypothetical protein
MVSATRAGGADRTPEERRWVKVLSTLNEAQARWFAADKALDLGRGGVSRLSEVTGMSRTTITKAIGELRARGALMPAAMGRVRREGGGRKRVEERLRGDAVNGAKRRGDRRLTEDSHPGLRPEGPVETRQQLRPPRAAEAGGNRRQDEPLSQGKPEDTDPEKSKV